MVVSRGMAGRRQPVASAPPGDQAARNIVAEAPPMALSVAGRQQVAGVITKLADERARRGVVGPSARTRTGCEEPRLHPVPEFLGDDGGMLSGMALRLVADATDIDGIGQQVV